MLNASEYVTQGVPVIAVQDIGENRLNHHDMVYVNELTSERLARYKVRTNDIIFGRKGAVERRAIIKESEDGFIQGSDCIRLRLSSSLEPKFFSYQFGSSRYREWMFQNATGATMPSLSQTVLHSLPVRVPSLPEQRAIAGVLSSLDDKIDLLHRQNQTLEAMAETLFRQWFIEEACDDTPTIADLVRHQTKIVVPSQFPNDEFYHFSLPAFDSGKTPSVELGRDILSGKFQVTAQSVLCSKLNPRVPRVWLIHETRENSVCSTEFQVLQPLNPWHKEYIYYQLRSAESISQLAMSASGTSGSHQRVRPQDILNLRLATADSNKMERFSKVIRPLTLKLNENLSQQSTISKLRDALLPKLMSGEVRVQYE
jgi:type I restriction enzyme S subunit